MTTEAAAPPPYDDASPRRFLLAAAIFGAVGMLVGLYAALELAFPALNFDLPFLTFGRLRPLHTSAVIFAFAANIVFAAIYHSSQRLLRTRMASDTLSAFHFFGWQAIVVAVVVTYPLGITQGKEYAEPEWPIDIAIAVVWVAFAVNFFLTIARRKVDHLYVAIWFYMATVITIAVLHVFNALAIPVSMWKSYSVYAGVQDALVQWWYGHNAVGFLLTTPFLGLMYYYLPKAADRPVFSYRLSIVHFWSLVFLYIWAGPHHLHYTALPDWAQTLGMTFSLMLIAPSWGGMLNGLLTLRGAWERVRTDVVLKFMVVAISFYGMSTLEGPIMSIRDVNRLSHYTDWTIGHVHSGALGWVGMISFATIYWLAPRLWGRDWAFPAWLNVHFWLATLGIVFYVVPMWAGGITQGLMWRALNDSGLLKYPDFTETVRAMQPFYLGRAVGGTLYLVGMLLLVVNLLVTASRGVVPAKEAA
jgi:cytochrome c oxidase cbb3-type subunit I/II